MYPRATLTGVCAVRVLVFGFGVAPVVCGMASCAFGTRVAEYLGDSRHRERPGYGRRDKRAWGGYKPRDGMSKSNGKGNSSPPIINAECFRVFVTNKI